MNVMVRSMTDGSAGGAKGADADRLGKLHSLAIERGGDVAAPRPPARRGRALLLAVIGLQAATIGWLGWRSHAPDAAPRPSVAKVPAAAPAVAGPRFEAQGFVVATRLATVSTRVAGIVTSVRVEAGDRVVRGQVLGTLDTELARRDLQLAERQLGVLDARLRAAEAQSVQAGAERDREQALFDRGFSTRARQIQAQTAAKVAAAGVDSARADQNVAALQARQQRSVLSNYTIRAPFAGIITEKNAQPGELIAPTGAGGGFTRTGLCTIVDMNSLEVVVDVNEQLVRRVQAGQSVRVSPYAYPDLKIAGRITRIMPSADRAKGTLQVRIALIDRDPRVLPEMGVRVSFL